MPLFLLIPKTLRPKRFPAQLATAVSQAGTVTYMVCGKIPSPCHAPKR